MWLLILLFQYRFPFSARSFIAFNAIYAIHFNRYRTINSFIRISIAVLVDRFRVVDSVIKCTATVEIFLRQNTAIWSFESFQLYLKDGLPRRIRPTGYHDWVAVLPCTFGHMFYYFLPSHNGTIANGLFIIIENKSRFRRWSLHMYVANLYRTIRQWSRTIAIFLACLPLRFLHSKRGCVELIIFWENPCCLQVCTDVSEQLQTLSADIP